MAGLDRAERGDWVSRALVATGLVALGAALASRRLGDFDLPWHLANGRQIVAHRGIPAVDDLAYGARPIEYTEALADLALHGLHVAGGPLALQVAAAAASVGIALVLVARAGEAGPAGWLATAVAMAAMHPWLLARPATFGALCLGALLLLVEIHRAAPTTARGRRALLAVVPLSFVWANVHPSVVLGAGVLVLRAACAWGARLAGRRWPAALPPGDGVDAGRTTGVAAASLCVAAINPMGAGLLLGPFRAQRDFALVTEWAPPDLAFLTVVEPATGVLLALVVLGLVAGRGPDGRVPPLQDAALVVTAFALAATAVRLVPFAAVLATPIAARRVAGLVPSSRAMHLSAGASVLLLAPLTLARSPVSLGIGFEPAHFPEGAVRWIEVARPAGPMWNFMPFGGYLALRLHPTYRVMIDGRSGFVHDASLVRRAHESNFDRAAFDVLAHELDVQWAVTRSREGEPFGTPLTGRRDWVMTYFDDVGAVYVRRDGPNRALADGGYRALHHLMPLDAVVRDVAAGRRAEAWSHDGALAARQAPDSPRAHVLDACGALATRDAPRFDRALASLAAAAPGHPSLEVLRAVWDATGRGG